jgi:hypothetical protein
MTFTKKKKKMCHVVRVEKVLLHGVIHCSSRRRSMSLLQLQTAVVLTIALLLLGTSSSSSSSSMLLGVDAFHLMAPSNNHPRLVIRAAATCTNRNRQGTRREKRRRQQQQALSASPKMHDSISSGIELSGVTYDSVSTAFDAWEWTNAISAPAALVAGAVLVTLGETREGTTPRKSDTSRVRFLKLCMRFLLLTSFALEVVSIFTAAITGTVLLGQSDHAGVAKKMIGYRSPLQLMMYHHE